LRAAATNRMRRRAANRTVDGSSYGGRSASASGLPAVSLAAPWPKGHDAGGSRRGTPRHRADSLPRRVGMAVTASSHRKGVGGPQSAFGGCGDGREPPPRVSVARVVTHVRRPRSRVSDGDGRGGTLLLRAPFPLRLCPISHVEIAGASALEQAPKKSRTDAGRTADSGTHGRKCRVGHRGVTIGAWPPLLVWQRSEFLRTVLTTAGPSLLFRCRAAYTYGDMGDGVGHLPPPQRPHTQMTWVPESWLSSTRPVDGDAISRRRHRAGPPVATLARRTLLEEKGGSGGGL